MLVIFSVTPIGVGEHLSKYVAGAVALVHDSDLPYQLTPMGTIIEGEWDECMDLIDRCRRSILKECPRVAIKIWLDDKAGVTDSMRHKVDAVQSILGFPVSLGVAGPLDNPSAPASSESRTKKAPSKKSATKKAAKQSKGVKSSGAGSLKNAKGSTAAKPSKQSDKRGKR